MGVGSPKAVMAPGRGRLDDPRRLFGVAVAVAAVQIALAWRLAAIDRWRTLVGDYALTLTIGWIAALCLAWERGASTSVSASAPSLRSGLRTSVSASAPSLRSGLRTSVKADRPWRTVGALMVVASLVIALARPAYGPADRLLPLLGGGGLLLMTCGARIAAWKQKECLLLALPLVNPLPRAVQDLVSPTGWTAGCAMVVDRLMGTPTTLDGTTLVMSGGTLEVLPGCDGLLGISRLWVLAILVVVLFSTNVQKSAWLLLSATLIGFLLNATRIAMLARMVMRGDGAAFQYWHEGRGADLFSLGSVAAAALVWWLMLRARRPLSGRDALPAIEPPREPGDSKHLPEGRLGHERRGA
jgi:exosortase/archaeosortase family protein